MANRKDVTAAASAGFVAVLSLAWSMGSQASCGAAFCAVNTNWNLQGLVAERGWRLDLRYEYIDQDQPTAGTKRVGVGEVPRHHDEVRTVNRNYVGTLDYSFDDAWGVAVTVPLSDRSHTHIHNHRGAKITEQWDFTRVGDVRVLGRHQWRAENAEGMALDFYGVNIGVKLPTGERDVRNAAGDCAERTLQPGTGTTDVVLGAYSGQPVTAYVRRLGLRYMEVRYDTEGVLSAALRARMLPLTIIIGRDGRERARHVGSVDWDAPPVLSFIEQPIERT